MSVEEEEGPEGEVRRRATVDFPVAMEPVRPIRSMMEFVGDLRRAGGMVSSIVEEVEESFSLRALVHLVSSLYAGLGLQGLHLD